MTTTELRSKNFELVVPVGRDGTARGELYLDDGVSTVQEKYSLVEFVWDGKTLEVGGHFGFDAGVSIERVVFLGLGNATSVTAGVRDKRGDVVVQVGKPLSGGFSITV